METLYFTATAIVLYFAADWALERIEHVLGRRLENRSLVFFGILLVMALVSFTLIRGYTGIP